MPRVIRRGFPYGPVYGAGGTEKRGLIGQFIAASLTRQFEKLMLWVHRTDFSPDFTDRAGQDPVMGDRRPGASTGFRLHTRVGPVDLPPLPRFVHGKGTVYLHIPSMRGLDTLAVGGVVT